MNGYFSSHAQRFSEMLYGVSEQFFKKNATCIFIAAMINH